MAQVDLLGVHLQVPGGIKTLNVPALGTSEGRGGGDHITCAVSKQLGPTPSPAWEGHPHLTQLKE